VEERFRNIEEHIGIHVPGKGSDTYRRDWELKSRNVKDIVPPIPPDIYARLKIIEDKIMKIEKIAPLYACKFFVPKKITVIIFISVYIPFLV